jgi:hypothetical protein
MAYYEDYEVRLGGLPDRDELADIILGVAQSLRDNFERDELIDEFSDNGDGSSAGTECRLQLIGGSWYWYDGDPQFDRDGRGYWGADWVPYDLDDREEALDIADRLIADVNDFAGQSGAFERLILGHTYDEHHIPGTKGAITTNEEVVETHHIPEFNGGLDDDAYTAACGCVVDGIEEAPERATLDGHVTCPQCLTLWDAARRAHNADVCCREFNGAPNSAKALFAGILRDLDRLEAGELSADEVREYVQRLVDLRLCYRLRPSTSLNFLEGLTHAHIAQGTVAARYGAALERP